MKRHAWVCAKGQTDSKVSDRSKQCAGLASLLITSTILGSANLFASAGAYAQQHVAEQTVRFNIPAQPLSSAINAFIRATGWEVGFASQAVAGKHSAPVSGSMTPAQALRTMLAGTGISAQVSGPSTAALTANTVASGEVSRDGSVVLGTITVQGENAWGPVNGFVATQSATATKTDTPIIETPQAISVVTRKQMDWQATQEVSQTLRYEPGVRTDMSVINRAQEINIRGFQVDGSAQGIYLDGLSLPTSWYGHYNINPYGLERVEVLRGPSSVLYGQNGPGGMVNLVSKRPTSEPLHEIELSTGSYGKKQAAFDLSGPVAKDKGNLLYRITGEIRDVGSQIEYTDTFRGFIAPSFTWKPDDDTSFTLLSSYQKLDRDGSNDQWLPAVGTISPTPNGTISRRFYAGEPGWDTYVQNQAMIGYAFEKRFDNNVTVRQNARFSHLDTTYRAVIPYMWGTNADGSTNYNRLDRYAFASKETANTFVIDNQLQYRTSTGFGDHTILGGVDYKHSYFDTKTGIGFDAAPIDPFNPVYGTQPINEPATYLNTHQTQRQLGLYLQDQIKFADRFIVSLGGRYDNATLDTDDVLKTTSTSKNDSAFTWRAGTVYLFDNGIAPYASYSTSFFPQTGTDFYGKDFKPTTGQSYEAGVKYQPPGKAALYTLSLFNITKQNVLTADPDATHAGKSVQTGEIRSRGIELSSKFSVSDTVDLTASYTFTDLKVTKSNSSDLGKVPFAAVPRHMASLWVDYALPPGFLEGLGLGGGVRWIGETSDDGEGVTTVPSFTLVDAAIRYELGHINKKLSGATFSVNATNIFDKTYVASCNNATTCYYGAGRVITARLKYKW